MSLEQWVRKAVWQMAGYTPGEQPRGHQSFVKLNTNENPYPPPKVVLDAIANEVDGLLRLYPEPSSLAVREAASRAYGVHPDQVLVGNGSDDLLTMIYRTFLEPGERVAYPDPTYTLYPALATLQGAEAVGVPWLEQGELPVEGLVATQAKVVIIARPNAPTGHVVSLDLVARLCRLTSGVVVLDEAYGDFATDAGWPLLSRFPNLIIIRTLSKSMCLAGIRLGLGFMPKEMAFQMHKVRDSYNVDRLAQAAAVAALNHLDAYRPIIDAIVQEREKVILALRQRGFQVMDSQANFVLATVPNGRRSGHQWLEELKKEGILVRYFGSDPRLSDKLRITIGTPEQMERLLDAVDGLLQDNT
ncbi:MAG: histidinol-phosphate transaminase [Magnetococcales bacterium]|nr:histidinol-phosphate transaminase [Magnetococcales bacterium]NGZ25429.1 histidinol-phosphate transaminase [Magnetococcales bacterium]